MAVIKIKTVKSKNGLGNLFRYIMHQNKIGEKAEVNGRYCFTQDADILYDQFVDFMELYPKRRSCKARVHHIIQSFAPGEVTPEKANELGMEFMKEAGLDEYQYAVITHVDRGHLHNHIVFNPIHLDSHLRLDTKRSFLYHLRNASDRVCERNNLTVIKGEPELKRKFKNYKEWDYAIKGLSYKDHVRRHVQYALNRSESYEDFASRLIAKGYKISMEPNQEIVIGKNNWSMKLNHLGKDYSTQKILARLQFNQEYGALAYMMDKPTAKKSKRFIRESIEAMKASGYYQMSDLATVMDSLRRERDIAEMKMKLSKFELKRTERIVFLADHLKNHADLLEKYNSATPEEREKMKQDYEIRSLLRSYEELKDLTKGDFKMIGHYVGEYEKHWQEIHDQQQRKEQAEKQLRLTKAFVEVRTSETYLTMKEREILENMGMDDRRSWYDRER